MDTSDEKRQQDEAPITSASDLAMAEELRRKEEKRLKKEEQAKAKKDAEQKYSEKKEREYKTLIDSLKESYPEPYVQEVIKDHADELCKEFWPKWYKNTCAFLFFIFMATGIAELWYFQVNDMFKDYTIGSITIAKSLIPGFIFFCNYFFCFFLMFLLRIWARKEFERNIREWCDNNSDDERSLYIRGEKWFTHVSLTDFWFLK